MNPEQPQLLPDTPEDAALLRAAIRTAAYKGYRRRTRPFRRTFRGIITRKDAERLYMSQKRARELEADRADV